MSSKTFYKIGPFLDVLPASFAFILRILGKAVRSISAGNTDYPSQYKSHLLATLL